MGIRECRVVIVLHDPPQVRSWSDDCLDLHDKLEDVNSLMACLVQSLDSHEEFDDIGGVDLLVVGKQDVVTDVWSDHIGDQHLDGSLSLGLQSMKSLIQI